MFLTNLRTSFESGLPEVTYSPIGDQSGSLMDDRLDFKEELEQHPEIVDDLQDATTISHTLDGAMSQYKELRDTSPAMLPSAITTTNNQIQDTSSILGIKPCYPVKLDPDTLELDQVSMEDYQEWLMQAGSSLIGTLKAAVNRGGTIISKFNSSAKGIDDRVANCYSLIKKRKDDGGGNPISISTNELARLVIDNEIATDLVSQLSSIGEVVNDLAVESLDLIGKTNSALKELLGADIKDAAGFEAILKSKVDNQKALGKLKAIASKDQLYLGNTRFKLSDEAKLIPSGSFVASKPDAKLIARSYGKVDSLSTDRIRSILGDIQKEVEKHVAVTNKSFKSIYSALKDIKVQAREGKNESNFDQVAATVKYVKQSTAEFRSMWSDIANMNRFYYQAAGGILTYVEESLLKD